jgi:hypothetical protein
VPRGISSCRERAADFSRALCDHRFGPGLSMSVMRNILMYMFGRPQGVLGRLGGAIMARTNADCGAWVSSLLEIKPGDRVLEAGFGPGVVIRRLSAMASAGPS